MLHQEEENLKTVKVMCPNVLTFVKASSWREFLNVCAVFFFLQEKAMCVCLDLSYRRRKLVPEDIADRMRTMIWLSFSLFWDIYCRIYCVSSESCICIFVVFKYSR